MCGLAGLVDLRGLDPDSTHGRLRSALSRLAPRGPDADGKWTDQHCAFAHTRLAVIDLTPGGAQPMRRDELVIIFNGEIFNFHDVRTELISKGHRFTSESDTEVLLAGWKEWGPALLPRLIGMFSFAIWNCQTRTLFAARDRFGEKPLLYACDGARLAIGSDLIACEAMLGAQREIDPDALRALFELRFIPEPLSIARGIAKLPAGHFLRFDTNGIEVSRWYDASLHIPQTPNDLPGQELGLRQRFDAAVRDRLISDVPVGVFLSGGIDSALVAASVASAGIAPKTFTVGFEGASSYFEERPLAAAVARHLKADHTEIEVPQWRASQVLDRVFLALDEPFADSSAVPTFIVSEETRKSVTVVLTGDGADEVFGGYRRYWGELYAKRWQMLPRVLRDVISTGLQAFPDNKNNRFLEMMRRVRRLADTSYADPVTRQAAWMQEFGSRDLDELLGARSASAYDVEKQVSLARANLRSSDPINSMLAADVAIGLPSDMLVKVDRMSMANALETRAPFLDQRVVEWAFAIDGRSKLDFAGMRPVGKRILRTAFRDRLPAEVFNRPKRGFEMPVRALLNGAARERLDAVCDPKKIRDQGLFNAEVVGKWQKDLSSGHGDPSAKLWTLLAFQEWARLHGRPERLPN